MKLASKLPSSEVCISERLQRQFIQRITGGPCYLDDGNGLLWFVLSVFRMHFVAVGVMHSLQHSLNLALKTNCIHSTLTGVG